MILLKFMNNLLWVGFYMSNNHFHPLFSPHKKMFRAIHLTASTVNKGINLMNYFIKRTFIIKRRLSPTIPLKVIRLGDNQSLFIAIFFVVTNHNIY